VLLWLVVLGHTQREVAEEMGVSVTTVRRLRDAAVEKVRHHVPAPFDPAYGR
jgi:DNA-directed RNA polymerase specialized sigma24 family protein